MKKRRVIPVVLLKNGWLVQSVQFSGYLNLGNPVWTVKRLSEWASDELIYLDITADDDYDTGREDLGYVKRRTFRVQTTGHNRMCSAAAGARC